MKKKIITLVVLLIVAAVVVAIWLSRDRGDDDELFASGTIEATEARLGFETAGRVQDVLVDEGDSVPAGAILAKLDSSELSQRRGQAVARLEATRALLAELERGSRPEEIGTVRAAVSAAEERLLDARRDLARTRTLFEGGAVSREALDKADSAATIAARNLEQASEQLDLVRSGPRRERIDAQRAQVSEAEAAVRAIDSTLEKATVAAPFEGVVTVRHRESNETVSPGQPVVTLMDPRDRWVRIYVPEDRIGAVHLGARALIRSDTFPDQRYEGTVTFIAPEAEFTPKSVQTTEERVRLVYAVKVQVTADEAMELKPGMPVDVQVGLARAAGDE